MKQAIEVLRAGGIVLFPTETSYGLAVDASNSRAVARLARLKGRDPKKSFPLIVSSLAMARRVAKFDALSLSLARRHWPGPLTLVLAVRPRSGLSSAVVREGTIAIRVSSNATARSLARRLGRPITSTSANHAGHPPARRITEVGVKADVVLDVGTLPRSLPSTIVRVKNGKVEIVRRGKIRL